MRQSCSPKGGIRRFLFRIHLKRKCCNAATSGAAQNAAPVHLQARGAAEKMWLDLWQHAITQRIHRFGRQKFSKARAVDAKWLKSALPSKMMCWWTAAVGAAGDPKTTWNSDYFASCRFQPAALALPPRPSEKQKDGIWFRGQIRFVHVRAGVSACFTRAASSAGDREMATSFTRSTHAGEPLSAQWDDRRWMAPWRWKKINKKALIVSEAMSSVSAGVWLQSAPHNSSSIGKTHLLCWSCRQTEEPSGFLRDTWTHVCQRRTCGCDSYHRCLWNSNRTRTDLLFMWWKSKNICSAPRSKQ